MIRYGSGTLYIDPWKLGKDLPQADIILLTHDHYDHYSEQDIRALSKNSTRVVAPMSTPVVTDRIKPGGRISISDITIEAIPAYNLTKAFHPKSNGWVGYIIEAGGKRIYHTGDTDRIPEMKGVHVDLALIPVGGTFTMDSAEAGLAASDMNAQEVIPIHFGDIVGTRADAEKLARSAKAAVHILRPGETYTLA